MTSSPLSKFELSPRRLLFVGEDRAMVFHWSKQLTEESYLFENSAEGLELFQRYLLDTPRYPTYILTDFSEEEFRQDTIPHVFGSDRTAVIDRKLSRLFRDSYYSYTEVQGREAEGRRDDRVLFSSITRPQLIRPWVALLEEQKVPLVSVSSVGLFTSDLVQLISEPDEQALVVSLQSLSGLRQSYFDGKELKLSRLIKMPRFSATKYPAIIMAEVDKVQRYLFSLRLVSVEKPLHIYFLCKGELKTELSKALQDEDTVEIQHHVVDLQELADKSGMNMTVTNTYSDMIYVYHALKKKFKNRYAKSSEKRYSNLRNIRYGLYGASIFLVFAAFLLSGFYFFKALNLKQESIVFAKKAEFYNARYQMAREGLPETPVFPQELKTISELADELKKYKTSPLDMMQLISTGLNEFPTIQLDNVEWQQETLPENQQQVIQPAPLPDLSNLDADKVSLFYQTAVIDAHLDEFDGNYRDAIQKIDDFAESLKKDKRVKEISILSLPLEVGSESTMKGDVMSYDDKAPFSLKIALAIEDE